MTELRKVIIVPQGTCYNLWINNENLYLIGRYTSNDEALKIKKLAETSPVWPPESGNPNIRWVRGRWRANVGKHEKTYIELEAAVKAVAEEKKKARGVLRPTTKADQKACGRCKWHMTTTTTTGKRYECGYCLNERNGSRVALHYQRTGRESLEGFTFGADCTEYEEGGKQDGRKPVRIRL